MRADLLAGTIHRPVTSLDLRPTVLVFDSGLGGLTVLDELRRQRPDIRAVYAADDAAFPYGRLDETRLVARVGDVMERLIARHAPDLVVVACNTASTLVLPSLRARFALPFVGTVPAVKPAAALSRSGRIAVLATPGTVRRDYTHGLIEAYAGDVRVDLVGSDRLAALAEAELSGAPASDDEVAAEIAPCFRDAEGRRTDVVVLACTHYPLLRARFETLAPWTVAWMDSAPAIARRVSSIVGEPRRAGLDDEPAFAVFTDGRGLDPALRRALAARGLGEVVVDPMPLPVAS